MPNYSPKVKNVQSLQVLTRVLKGEKQTDIAKDLGITPRSVTRRINWGIRAGLFDKAQDKALTLADKALKVYEKALDQQIDAAEEGEPVDITAARDIAYGLGVLSKEGKNPASPSGTAELTLESWREVRRLKLSGHPQDNLDASSQRGEGEIPASDPQGEEAVDEASIEGELLDSVGADNPDEPDA